LPWDAAAELERGKIAVFCPDRKLPMRLDPLLMAETLDSTIEVCFLNGIRRSGDIEHLSYSTGQTRAASGTAAELVALLDTDLGRSAEADMVRTAELNETVAELTDSYTSLMSDFG
jgi:hypothetical protein